MPSTSEESQDTEKGTHMTHHPKRRSGADSAIAQMLELLNRDNRDYNKHVKESRGKCKGCVTDGKKTSSVREKQHL